MNHLKDLKLDNCVNMFIPNEIIYVIANSNSPDLVKTLYETNTYWYNYIANIYDNEFHQHYLYNKRELNEGPENMLIKAASTNNCQRLIKLLNYQHINNNFTDGLIYQEFDILLHRKYCWPGFQYHNMLWEYFIQSNLPCKLIAFRHAAINNSVNTMKILLKEIQKKYSGGGYDVRFIIHYFVLSLYESCDNSMLESIRFILNILETDTLLHEALTRIIRENSPTSRLVEAGFCQSSKENDVHNPSYVTNIWPLFKYTEFVESIYNKDIDVFELLVKNSKISMKELLDFAITVKNISLIKYILEFYPTYLDYQCLMIILKVYEPIIKRLGYLYANLNICQGLIRETDILNTERVLKNVIFKREEIIFLFNNNFHTYDFMTDYIMDHKIADINFIKILDKMDDAESKWLNKLLSDIKTYYTNDLGNEILIYANSSGFISSLIINIIIMIKDICNSDIMNKIELLEKYWGKFY